MTPGERIEHIRQCLRRMKPVMGYEVAAVNEIEKELVILEEYLTSQDVAIGELRTDMNRLNEMIRDLLNGGACG